jgi:4-amino-4-deoxy-L-arabinose transferase-like glycosyltransferase
VPEKQKKMNILSLFKILKLQFPPGILCVFLAGFLVRLFAFFNTYIVNQDGAYYIHQAKALFFNQFESLTSCALPYLSNYPFFIAGAYALFNDWEVAAKSVSIFFGTITLIPIYLLLKRFFDERISILATLIFAFTPVLVSRSVDVVKGPVYWFFLVLGLLFYVLELEKKKPVFLVFASISFLMAAWARVDALFFIVMSSFHILVAIQGDKIKRLCAFISPVFILIVCLAIFSMSTDSSFGKISRTEEVSRSIKMIPESYNLLRDKLADQAAGQPYRTNKERVLNYFLTEARTNIWIVAFGTLLNRTLESFFYPFFLIFALGLIGIREKLQNDKRFFYFLLLVFSGLIVLYCYILSRWVLEYRYFALVIFPGMVFTGIGLEKAFNYLQSRSKAPVALILILLFIFSFGLSKNLQDRRGEDLVYKNVGRFISEREGNNEVAVATSEFSQSWVALYSNSNSNGASCLQLRNAINRMARRNYNSFLKRIKARSVKYFLWEEKLWPHKSYSFIKKDNHRYFKELKRWEHEKIGEIILFEII